MADLADVERALVAQAACVMFAGAAYLPMAAQACITGETIKIYRGWPDSSVLDADLAAGLAHVTVFAEQGMTRLTTRFQPDWIITTATAPTLTATVAGRNVTFAGTAGLGQVAGVLLFGAVRSQAWAYRTIAGSTPSSVAAALAALCGGSAVGPVLTMPGAAIVQASVVADQTAVQETRRQAVGFRLSCWCPSATARDALAGALDTGMAGIFQFVTADNTACVMRYRTTYSDDKISKDGCWRRDLCYTVEYGTTPSQTQTPLLFPGALLNAPNPIAIGDIQP